MLLKKALLKHLQLACCTNKKQYYNTTVGAYLRKHLNSDYNDNEHFEWCGNFTFFVNMSNPDLCYRPVILAFES